MLLAPEEIVRLLEQEPPDERLLDRDYLLTLVKNIEDLYKTISSNEAALTSISQLKLDLADGNDFSMHSIDEIKASLIELANNFDRSKTKFNGQEWYMDRMKACGFNVISAGCCYGMRQMGKQAFFSDDIATFNQRLQSIYDSPMQDFEEYVTETNKSKDKIIDFLAFFNGIIITQYPELFVDLFSDDNKTIFQNSKKTQSLTLPNTLQAAEKEIVDISTFTGAYSKDELIEYFLLLQSNLGQHSFTLSLGSANHAIGVYYDSRSQHWLLQDPNNLPGFEYTHPDLLVKSLLSYFFRPDACGVVMRTTIETLAEHHDVMKSDFLNMKKKPEWARLHEISDERVNQSYPYMKSNIKYEDTQWRYADKEWVDTALSNVTSIPEETFFLVCYGGDRAIASFNQMVEITPPTIVTLNYALSLPQPGDSIEIIKRLLEMVSPTESSLKAALSEIGICGFGRPNAPRMPSLEIIKLVLEKVTPSNELLNDAIRNNKIDIVPLFIEKIKLTASNLTCAIMTGNIDMIALHIQHMDIKSIWPAFKNRLEKNGIGIDEITKIILDKPVFDDNDLKWISENQNPLRKKVHEDIKMTRYPSEIFKEKLHQSRQSDLVKEVGTNMELNDKYKP